MSFQSSNLTVDVYIFIYIKVFFILLEKQDVCVIKMRNVKNWMHTHDPRNSDPRPTRLGPTTHEDRTHDPRGLDPRPTRARTHEGTTHEGTNARGHETHEGTSARGHGTHETHEGTKPTRFSTLKVWSWYFYYIKRYLESKVFKFIRFS